MIEVPERPSGDPLDDELGDQPQASQRDCLECGMSMDDQEASPFGGHDKRCSNASDHSTI